VTFFTTWLTAYALTMNVSAKRAATESEAVVLLGAESPR
jgi:hypothetical protein